MKLLVAVLVLFAAASAADAATYYVAPTGTPSGTGSFASPWDLRTALEQGGNPADTIGPGDTLWLRGGTYIAKGITAALEGTSNSPIWIRKYPGETPVLDGNLSTTLGASMLDAPEGSSSTFINLADSSRVWIGATVQIDDETMQVIDNNGTPPAQYRVVRGTGGTTTTAHSSGATVRFLGIMINDTSAFTYWWDVEFTNTNTQRRFTTHDDGGIESQRRGEAIDSHAPGARYINLVIHDVADGIGSWSEAVDSTIEGCVLLDNGVVDLSRGHGHGIYIQNSTGQKLIRDVISVNNFSTGMKAFGESGSAIGITFDGIIAANAGSQAEGWDQIRTSSIFVGTGGAVADDIHIRNISTYDPPGAVGAGIRFGYASPDNGSIEITNSILDTGRLLVDQWDHITFTGNTVTQSNTSGDSAAANLTTSAAGVSSGYAWDNNAYYVEDDHPFVFDDGSVEPSRLTFSAWKAASAVDANSTYEEGDGRPSGTRIVTRPNRYERGRVHVAIYNWGLASSVTVPLGDALRPGDAYEVILVERWGLGPVSTGVYNGVSIVIPMTSPGSPRQAIGYVDSNGDPYFVNTTLPEFGAFVVRRKP